MTAELLHDYATRVLGSTVFVPDLDKPEDLPFAAGLIGIQHLLPGLSAWQNAAGDGLSVIAGYVERMTPNASADRHDGTHVIVMHQALMVTILEFALFAFTQRDVFPEVGAAEGEASPSPEGGYAPGILLLRKTHAGIAITPEADRVRVPVDAERHVMATYLAILMARFVWLHELAHCQCGHVGLVQAQRLALRLYEVPEPMELVGFAQEPARTSMLHLMELEADAVALQYSVWMQADAFEVIDGIKALPRELRLALVLFGAYAMTWLFEEYQVYMQSEHGLTHPRPRDRLRHLFRHAALAGQGVDGFDAIHDHVQAQFDALRRAIPHLHSWTAPGDAPAADPRMLAELLAPHRYVQISP